MTLTTQTFDGLPGGMNLALPAEEIDDTEARYMQDVLVDQPGLNRRRGPVAPVTGIASLSRKGSGLVGALDPQGNFRIAVLTGDNSTGFLTVYNNSFGSTVDLAWPFRLPNNPQTSLPYSIVDAKPALRGGALIGVSSAYDSSLPNQALGFWFGGTKANATLTITATRGSQTVTTGAGFSANVDPGMFLFANTDDPYSQAYLGIVKSVNSDTSITLVAPSLHSATAKSGTFQSLRGFAPKVSKGHITTDTSSAVVTGGATKFRSQKLDTGTVLTGTLTNAAATVTGLSSTTGLVPGMPVTGTNVGSGARILSVDSSSQVTLTVNSTGNGSQTLTFKVPWDIYRASDGTWVGTVLSVQSEIGLTLMANAAISMSDEAFVAIRADADFSLLTTASTQKVGFLTASYADRQWYFNNGADFSRTSRGWFSDTADPEIVDLSDFDGDWVDIVSTANVNEPIRAVGAAYNGLCVCKENETFLITGSSPSSFGVRKLEDDGALHAGSLQSYGGGVIWAGREGIHFYDGINTENLTQAKLGTYWKDTIRTFDPTTYRMWSMVNRDHYMLFIESIAPTTGPVKGNVSTAPTSYTVSINMTTRAITLFTNVNMRGSVVLPGSAGRTAWYLVNGQTLGDLADHAIIANGESLFNQEGPDAVICDLDTSAPWANLVPNGSATVDVAHWATAGTATGSSLTRDTSRTVDGLPASFRLASNTGFTMYVPDRIGIDTTPLGSIVAGQTYTLSFWTKADAVGTAWGGDPGFYDHTFSTWVPATDGVVITVDGVPVDPASVTDPGFMGGVLKVHATDTNWHYWTWTFVAPVGSEMASPEFYGQMGGIQTFNLASIQLESGSVAHGYIDTVDVLAAPSGTNRRSMLALTPDFYIESKKYDAGDGLRLKRFKQLALWYLAQGDAMKVDTVLGLNNIGQTLTSTFPVSGYTWDSLRSQIGTWNALKTQFASWSNIVQSVFVPKRVRFQKKNQYMAFRLYQASRAVTRMQTGPFQLGFKLQRPGRI